MPQDIWFGDREVEIKEKATVINHIWRTAGAQVVQDLQWNQTKHTSECWIKGKKGEMSLASTL